MELGSIRSLVLNRSAIKHTKRNDKALVLGAGTGKDYSLDGNGVVLADGSFDDIRIAFIKAMNNFVCSGKLPTGARVSALLPADTKEGYVKKFMSELNVLCNENRVQLLGGHTEFGEQFAKPFFVVTLSGVVEDGDRLFVPKNASVGDDIVMTKSVGILGKALILKERLEILEQLFPKSFLKQEAKNLLDDEMDYDIAEDAIQNSIFSIYNEAKHSIDFEGTKYLHDITGKGLYEALLDVSDATNKGLVVYHDALNISQGVIEFCEAFGANPYMLEGTGSAIVVSSDGEALVNMFNEQGIVANVIGKITSEKTKYISFNNSETRMLSPVKEDEIYKIRRLNHANRNS